MLTDALNPILGGLLIGLAATWTLLALGRVSGISGILAGLLGAPDAQTPWRGGFVAGLLVGGVALAAFFPRTIAPPDDRSLAWVAVAGLLVGFGTQLGSGCTSGHGVCGLTRLSRRSLVAVLTFIATGALSASLFGLLGGAS